MAAEESSQGDALGPDFSEPTDGGPPAEPETIDLRAVLGEFMIALCVVEMVYRTLWDMMDSRSEEIGSCAVALRHGFEMLDVVYNRFDQGLLDYIGPDDDPDDDLDDDDHDDDEAGPDDDGDRAGHRGDQHRRHGQGRVSRRGAAGGSRLVAVS